MSMLRRSVSLTLVVGLFVATGVRPALAGCTQASEAKAVKRSLKLAVKCNNRVLRAGPGITCRQSAAPACADTLVGDAAALGYGANNPASAAVDRKTMREQLSCQRRIGKAVSTYVGTYLRLIVRGLSATLADQRARRQLDRLPDRCLALVAQDASGVVLPAVGSQCGAAIGDPGGAVDGPALRDCLHTLLQVWVDRVGPNPQPLRPNIVFILTDDQRWDTTDGTHSPSGSSSCRGHAPSWAITASS